MVYGSRAGLFFRDIIAQKIEEQVREVGCISWLSKLRISRHQPVALVENAPRNRVIFLSNRTGISVDLE